MHPASAPPGRDSELLLNFTGITQASEPLRSSLVRLWRLPGLNGVLNASVRYAPAPLRTYVEHERLKTRLRDRRRAVAEGPYAELLRRGLAELRRRVGIDALGDYLEFGVYNGTSLITAFREIEAMRLSGMRLFGFDSFEGLPAAAATDDEGLWKPGDWCSDLEFTRAVLASEGIDEARVTLIPGWFSDTCSADTARQHGIEKASIVMVDCDIYTSAREALAFCAPLIRDHALVIFDDWHSGQLAAKNLGERRAFEEWLAEWGCFRHEPFGSYSRRSETFMIARVGKTARRAHGSRACAPRPHAATS
jgi:hypothetical protein